MKTPFLKYIITIDHEEVKLKFSTFHFNNNIQQSPLSKIPCAGPVCLIPVYNSWQTIRTNLKWLQTQ